MRWQLAYTGAIITHTFIGIIIAFSSFPFRNLDHIQRALIVLWFIALWAILHCYDEVCEVNGREEHEEIRRSIGTQ
jgi:hypothetical protein